MKLAALLATAALGLTAVAQTKGEPPAQAKRGMELFRNSEKGACITCHKMQGVGEPVGPDLAKTASVLPPRALAMAIRATMTVYVLEVKPKTGAAFPAMKVDDLSFYDLSTKPPELKKFAKGEFETAGNTKWKHPPESAGYTPEQLADVIAYLRFVGANDKKGVDPEEIQ
jgi:mono/diheme cytochrome c family protein